jgi:CRP/FNR family transcriptional regulator, nitrogen oxide reductase regulator
MSRETGDTANHGMDKRESDELGAAGHISLIFEDPPELTAFVVPYFRSGLAEGQRCVYVSGELDPTVVTGALVEGGVDVKREIERGALILLSAQEYYALPPFDAPRVIELMRRREAEASSRGFTGLRIAGDMTWTLQEGIADDTLVEYEALLDGTGVPGFVTAVCIYQRDRFQPAVLQRLISSHTRVVAGDSVLLGLSALFHNLARPDLQRLQRSSGERRKRKGEFYFHQGDPATEVFVLTSGKVKVVRTEPDGRSVIIRIVAPMEPFTNPSALLDGAQGFASAQAMEDSRAFVWDASTILREMTHHPVISLNAVRLMAERFQENAVRLRDLATANVERRLARLLLRLAQSMGRKTAGGVAIDVPLSGHDLAELTIATPYTVSRILAGWRRRRVAEVRRQRILILDPQRMAALAGLRAK